MTSIPTAKRLGQITLEFTDGPEPWRPAPKKIAESVSAVVASDRFLWVCSDQTATVELLTAADTDQPGAYRDHRSFRLGDVVTLPQDGDTEVDLEGADLQRLDGGTGYLWLIGSHSWARDRVKDDDSREDAVDKLRSVSLDLNRRCLMRIPVVAGADGVPRLVASWPDPPEPGPRVVAGLLTELADEIALDRHLGAFAGIPGKDNGVDVEGLAVAGDRVFVGLRGPVLRGWAVVLELGVEPAGESGVHGERLRLRRGEKGRPFRKHFLELGLGIRELYVDDDDLVILAGPTMVLDGPVRLLRWKNGAVAKDSRVVRAKDTDLTVVHELPYGTGDNVGKDHAEGFTRLRGADGSTTLVVYDSPTADRLSNGREHVRADLFAWP